MTLLQEALAPRSDQLNADDLIPGPRTIKITGARIVEGDRGGKRITIHFEGDQGKPWKACKTMGRAMVLVWGIVDDTDEAKVSAQFVGKSVTLYRDPEVKFGDQGAVGGIRISHMSHIDGPKSVKLTVSQGKKAQFVFQPLTADVRQIAGATDDLGAFARKFIAACGRAPDLAKLDAYAAGVQAKLDALTDAIPEAHAACLEALETKRASFAPADDDDPFPDEAPDLSPADQTLANIRESIAGCKRPAELDTVDKLWEKHRAAYSDEIAAEIDGLIAARRKALQGEG